VPERPIAYFILADNGAPSPLVQPGRLAARFSLTSGRGLRASDCARFAWGFSRPPVVAAGDDGGQGPLEVHPDSVLISAVKRAWDGNGLVVRVVEYDGLAAGATLRLPFAPKRAWLADPVERPLSPLPVEGDVVRFPVKPHEVLTLLIDD
jgi:alpha-mannosidase